MPPDVGVVEWVIDGDTVDIDIGGREERVRLIGIDTPELHTDAGGAECMAREALEFTAAELPAGTEVRLERDVVGRDDYGRLLAYVYRRADDVLINELDRRPRIRPAPDDRPERHLPRAIRRRSACRRGSRPRSLGVLCRVASPSVAASIERDVSLNERLGYSPEAKLVILSCDDLGSCHAANEGVYQAIRRALRRAPR